MTRIISGTAGSLRLEVPKAGTRPTSDRVREAIFSSLDSWNMLAGTRVLDLYAGSGALGLEAASRGSTRVSLVEKHPQAAQVASRNARVVAGAFAAGVAPNIEVHRQSVQTYLEQLTPASIWDVVFIDPPYDLAESVIAENLASLVPLLSPEAVVLVERSSRSPEPVWPDGLTLMREKRHGETMLWWAEPSTASQAS